jgi:hypothetical protein
LKLLDAIYTYDIVKVNNNTIDTVGAHHDNTEILFSALSALSLSNFDEQSERLQNATLTIEGQTVMDNNYKYDAVDSMSVTPMMPTATR